MNRIGPLIVIESPQNCKVPYSRSLFIDSPERVLIDSGAEPQALLEIEKQFGLESIMYTHYHPDHTQYGYLFPNAEKIINPIEFEATRSLDNIAKEYAIVQEMRHSELEKWKQSVPPQWEQSLQQISKVCEYDTDYSFGEVKTIFLHTPGHTKGFSCPYFPELGVVFTGDYDMSSFGPWYNGTDGNIDDFINSGKMLLQLDADTYITGHHKGIFTKTEFKKAMEAFLSVIDKREEAIAKYVSMGLTFEELTNVGIFYQKPILENPIYQVWERSGIRKHLKRMGLSVPEMEEGKISLHL